MAVELKSSGQCATLIERLLDEQRERWRRGERVLVEALLAPHPVLADDREGLLDLIWNEVDLRALDGETPKLEEYRQRFPHLSQELSHHFEVYEAAGQATPLPGEATASGAPAPTCVTQEQGAAEPSSPWREAGYEILEKLGQGAMGVVYKARHRDLQRLVALKMVGDADRETLDRFRDEAQAVARLHHPHIVEIYEVGQVKDGQQAGRPYLALEFVAGGGLDKRLTGAPVSGPLAARFVETLAQAVQHAHQRGVIHRDLKPGNILLQDAEPEGQQDAASAPAAGAAAAGARSSASLATAVPKIADFGLAKLLGDASGRTQSGSILGTPSYMAPEQAAGQVERIGPATDVYALGAVLYELLTGRPPFRGTDVWDTLDQVRRREPVAPRELQPKVPRDLETICLKCLQKAGEKRYASAAALGDDLRRYLEGRPIAARPVGRAERLWRWCRRNPKDAGMVAAGLLAVVLGGLVYRWVEKGYDARRAQATAQAETDLKEVDIFRQRQGAAVGALPLWEKGAAAAERAKAVVKASSVAEATRARVKRICDEVKVPVDDQRLNADLDKLALASSACHAARRERYAPILRLSMRSMKVLFARTASTVMATGSRGSDSELGHQVAADRYPGGLDSLAAGCRRAPQVGGPG